MDAYYIFGTINLFAAIAFILAIIGLIVEMFTPGLGIAGGMSFVMFILAAIIQAQNISQALIMIAVILIVFVVLFLIAAKSAKGGAIFRSPMVLKQAVAGRSPELDLVGKVGETITPLRPSGSVRIDGKRYDAITQGEFLKEDVKVRVAEVNGLRMLVEEVK